jgi:3-oxoadipate enol-lactonase
VSAGTLCCQIAGNGPDAVIFVHGFGLDRRMWTPIVSSFARDHIVVTYDLRGFGESSMPTVPYSHASDLARLLKTLGLRKAHVVGFSLGGTVALDFALSHQNRVLTLTLANSIPAGFPRAAAPISTGRALRQAAAVRGVAEAKRRFVEGPLFKYSNSSGATTALIPIIADYSGWHWLNEDSCQWLMSASEGTLRRLEMPTLVITSSGDRPDVRRAGDWLHRGIRGAQLAVLYGVGHFAPIETAEPFVRLVRDFISSSNVTAVRQ